MELAIGTKVRTHTGNTGVVTFVEDDTDTVIVELVNGGEFWISRIRATRWMNLYIDDFEKNFVRNMEDAHALAIATEIYSEILCKTIGIEKLPIAIEPPARVTYYTSGLKRRTKTVDGDTLRWMENDGRTHGIRVTSSRAATKAEIARGLYTGPLNV